MIRNGAIESQYSKKYASASELPLPSVSGLARRVVRKSGSGELMDDLWIDGRTSRKRIYKQLRAPVDIDVIVEINAIANDDEEIEPELMEGKDASLFRAVVARINFLAQDRSDLQFASKECSRRMAVPRVQDWELVKRVGRYIAGRPRVILMFRWQDAPVGITVYSDSDWAGCRVTRKSTSGACFMHGQHLLKSYSKTQANIALSSAEAELYSFVSAASEAIGLKSMMRDFGVPDAPASLRVDASAAIGIAECKGLGKLRHLDTQSLWIQDAVRQRRVKLEKVLGTENPADLMTKYLDQRTMDHMLSKMDIHIVGGRAETAPQVSGFEASKAYDPKVHVDDWVDASEDIDSIDYFVDDCSHSPGTENNYEPNDVESESLPLSRNTVPVLAPASDLSTSSQPPLSRTAFQ